MRCTADRLREAAEEVFIADENGNTGFMCLRPSIANEVMYQRFKAALRAHQISTTGDLGHRTAGGHWRRKSYERFEREDRDASGVRPANHARIFFLLLLAESGTY